MKLRWRLALLNGLVVLVVLLFSVGLLLFTTRVALERDVDRNLLRQAENGSRMFLNRPPDRLGEPASGPNGIGGPRPMAPPDSPMRAFDESGRSLRQNPPQVPFDPKAVRNAGPPRYSSVTIDGRSMRVFTRRIIDPQGQPIIVQVGMPRENIDQLLAAQISLAFSLIPLALLMAAGAGWFLAGRAVNPLARFTQAAATISDQSMDERMPTDGDEEISTLGKTFNAMLERLGTSFSQRDTALTQVEAALERQKQFVADASHELRTPLTRMKLVASAAGAQDSDEPELREALAVVNRSADAMEHLIDQLLVLAKSADGGAGFSMAPLALDDWLRAVVPSEVPLSSAATPTVDANPDALARALENLVSNAQRHAQEVSVTLTQDGNSAHIEVADRGPGVPEASLSKLTERFYRVDSARARRDGGTGLGLAICDAIVRAHGGTLEFKNRDGGGLVATLRLPVRASK